MGCHQQSHRSTRTGYPRLCCIPPAPGSGAVPFPFPTAGPPVPCPSCLSVSQRSPVLPFSRLVRAGFCVRGCAGACHGPLSALRTVAADSAQSAHRPRPCSEAAAMHARISRYAQEIRPPLPCSLSLLPMFPCQPVGFAGMGLRSVAHEPLRGLRRSVAGGAGGICQRVPCRFAKEAGIP